MMTSSHHLVRNWSCTTSAPDRIGTLLAFNDIENSKMTSKTIISLARSKNSSLRRTFGSRSSAIGSCTGGMGAAGGGGGGG